MAIPGGFEEYGFYEEAFDQKFLDLIIEFNKRQKPIAAVCVAALALGKSGILIDRKATTYHLKKKYRQIQLQEYCCQILDQSLVIDQNIITSSCPETAVHVAFELLNMLIGQEPAQSVKTAMGY